LTRGSLAGKKSGAQSRLLVRVYDEIGNFYKVPSHIAADPPNLTESPAEDEINKSRGRPEDERDQAELRREEKGKGVLHSAELITVKARLSDRGGPDVKIALGKEQSIRVLARRVQEEAGVGFVRLVVVIRADGFPAWGREQGQDCVHGKDPERRRDIARPGLDLGTCCQRIGLPLLIHDLEIRRHLLEFMLLVGVTRTVPLRGFTTIISDR
jgi:hypothetical protein